MHSARVRGRRRRESGGTRSRSHAAPGAEVQDPNQPRFWYFAMAQCGEPAPISASAVDFQLTLVNPGGFFNRQFSRQHQGVLETCIAALVLSLAVLAGLLIMLLRRKVNSDRVGAWLVGAVVRKVHSLTVYCVLPPRVAVRLHRCGCPTARGEFAVLVGPPEYGLHRDCAVRCACLTVWCYLCVWCAARCGRSFVRRRRNGRPRAAIFGRPAGRHRQRYFVGRVHGTDRWMVRPCPAFRVLRASHTAGVVLTARWAALSAVPGTLCSVSTATSCS